MSKNKKLKNNEIPIDEQLERAKRKSHKLSGETPAPTKKKEKKKKEQSR